MNLMPLFLVSLASVGYETALTRYFAVSKWSEYGYWVISIVMVGFALSGVMLALWRDAFAKRGELILAILPPILVVTAAAGYFAVTVNPFNPLQLQNPVTWQPQLLNIGFYYLALLPFFFLAGTFVSLNFVMYYQRIGRVYAFDLTGAGAGAAGVLASMFAVHAFHLVPLLLVPLGASALFVDRRWRKSSTLATVLALVVGEAGLIGFPQADFNDFKAIYAPMHTEGAKVVAQSLTPRGDYLLLDDFQERVDADISNNAGAMNIPGPPRTYGLYRDGNRIAALPMTGELDVGYAPATLDALPYTLVPGARVLVVGASGGFNIRKAFALGASQARVLEPEPELDSALRLGMGPSPAFPRDTTIKLAKESPLGVRPGVHDIVDISSDFLDTAETNVNGLTAEAMVLYIRSLAAGGMVSIPVSIRDFPVYGLRMLATAREAMLRVGIEDPTLHTVVYRSAWSVRILVSSAEWTPSRLAAIKAFCDERSFDLSWYPGMKFDPERIVVYNDLPRISFETGQVLSTQPDDALAREAGSVLAGKPVESMESFTVAPVTLDRPFFYAALRIDRLGALLRRLEVLPQQEIGVIVNLAVLAQALAIAAAVLLIPLAARKKVAVTEVPTGEMVRALIYFAALGLGFLFIEIYLIEKASLWLNDRTSGFALVLTGMLIFSGAGSMVAERLSTISRPAMTWICAIVLVWIAAVLLWLQPLVLATLSWPWVARAALLMAIVAPISLPLGLPFPLGLSKAGKGGLLPWAWGLNGAFSVVATPLANLIAREAGFSRVLFCAAILYAIARIAFPATRSSSKWQNSVQPSVAAE